MGAIYGKTDNYGLDLYGDKDPADLRDGHNANMHILDDMLKTQSDGIAYAKNTADEAKKTADGAYQKEFVYTKTESDEKLALKSDKSDTYTKLDVDGKTKFLTSILTPDRYDIVGDGVSDDSDNFNKMLTDSISQHKTIVLESGRTYRIGCSISLQSKDRLSIVGNGATIVPRGVAFSLTYYGTDSESDILLDKSIDNIVFQYSSESTGGILVTSPAGAETLFSVRNCTFNMQSAHYGSYGVSMTRMPQSSIRDNRFVSRKNCDGIIVKNCLNSIISRNEFVYMGSAVKLYQDQGNLEGVIFSDNIVINSVSGIVTASQNNDLIMVGFIISGNVLDQISQKGISLGRGQMHKIVNNYIGSNNQGDVNPDFVGLEFSGTGTESFDFVSGNVFSGNKKNNAINFHDLQLAFSTISENQFFNNGIDIFSSKNGYRVNVNSCKFFKSDGNTSVPCNIENFGAFTGNYYSATVSPWFTDEASQNSGIGENRKSTSIDTSKEFSYFNNKTSNATLVINTKNDNNQITVVFGAQAAGQTATSYTIRHIGTTSQAIDVPSGMTVIIPLDQMNNIDTAEVIA